MALHEGEVLLGQLSPKARLQLRDSATDMPCHGSSSSGRAWLKNETREHSANNLPHMAQMGHGHRHIITAWYCMKIAKS